MQTEPLETLRRIDALLAPGESDPDEMARLLTEIAEIVQQALAEPLPA